MRKVILLVLAMFALCTPAWADEDVKVYLNGAPLSTDGAAYISSGRTMVPMRAIFEAFDFDVSWSPSEQRIDASRNGFALKLQIDMKTAVINGDTHTLDVAPTLYGGRTYVPLRFVSEALGADVRYDAGEKAVYISTAQLDQTVAFADPLLRAEMNKLFGKDTIKRGDAFYVTDLKLRQYGIRNLAGMEYFVNLKSLDLAGNEISDIAPVGMLRKLVSLNLSDNNVMDIGPLRGLTALKNLDISDNRVNSFIHLNYLKDLKTLKLLNNKSEAFSQIYFIADQLETIDVDRGKIELPKFDTAIARLSARFETPITNSLTWVPAGRIGGSSLLNENMKTLLRQSPDVKQNKVTSFYESIQLLFFNKQHQYRDVVAQVTDSYNVAWRIYPGGSETLRINQGGQAGLAAACSYLLADDYPERGYLLILKADGAHVVLNYFRSDKYITVQNEKDEDETVLDQTYYAVNYAAFSRQNDQYSPAPETGILSDFNASSGVYGNLLMSKRIETAAEELAKADPGIQKILQIKVMDRKDTPIAVGTREGATYLPSDLRSISKTLVDRGGELFYRSLDLEKPYFSQYPSFDVQGYQ